MCTGEAKVKESVPPVIMADLTEENDDAPVKSPDPRVGNHFYLQAMKNKIGNTFITCGSNILPKDRDKPSRHITAPCT